LVNFSPPPDAGLLISLSGHGVVKTIPAATALMLIFSFSLFSSTENPRFSDRLYRIPSVTFFDFPRNLPFLKRLIYLFCFASLTTPKSDELVFEIVTLHRLMTMCPPFQNSTPKSFSLRHFTLRNRFSRPNSPAPAYNSQRPNRTVNPPEAPIRFR